jgi:hypothetical protein
VHGALDQEKARQLDAGMRGTHRPVPVAQEWNGVVLAYFVLIVPAVSIYREEYFGLNALAGASFAIDTQRVGPSILPGPRIIAEDSPVISASSAEQAAALGSITGTGSV